MTLEEQLEDILEDVTVTEESNLIASRITEDNAKQIAYILANSSKPEAVTAFLDELQYWSK